MVQSVLGQGIQQHTGLYPHIHVLFVIAQDLFHPGGAQHQAPLDRSGASGQTGAGAPDGNRDVMLVAQLHDGSDFFRTFHINGGFRHADAVNGHVIMGIVRVDVFPGNHALSGNLPQSFQNFRCNRLVFDHLQIIPLHSIKEIWR